MLKINIHSSPLKDVIQDFADRFHTTTSQKCDEFSVRLPSEFGEGKITGINFDSGLGLIQYDCKFNSDVEIHFNLNQIHPLKFIFCTRGVLEHWFEKTNDIHNINAFQNIIVASKHYNGHVLKFTKEIRSEIFSLEIDREKFIPHLSCAIESSKSKLKNLFQDIRAEKKFYFNGYYCLTLAEIFDELNDQNNDLFIHRINTESQSYRMLLHQLIQVEDDGKSIEKKKILRKAELFAMLQAIDIIKNELDDLGTITSIAKRVGLNTDKFQDGFRKLHGKTANQYIQNLRLDLARDLLVNTEDTVQEIKYKIGFKSHSYFSYLFKQIYKMSPSEFRKLHHEGKADKKELF